MCQHTEICQVDALELSHPPMWDNTEIHPSAVAWLSLIFSLKLCSSGFIQCVQKILVISLKQVAKVSMDLQPEYSGLQSTAVFLHQSELRPVRSTDNQHKWHEKCPMKLLRLLCSYDTSGGVFDCSFSCCFDPPDSTFCVNSGSETTVWNDSCNVMFLRNVYRAQTVCTERCRLHPWEIPEVKIKRSHSLIRSTCSLLYPVGIFSVQISSSISLAQTQRTIAFCQGTGKRQ